MRIAQLAPLAESVPPKLYGGTERVISWLTEELCHLGHKVTLFATGDSSTGGELVPIWPRALRLAQPKADPAVAVSAALEVFARRAHEFDVLHCHVDWVHLPMLTRLGIPFLTTLHGRLDLPGLQTLINMFPEAPFVSISDSQRKPLPTAKWLGTVYHGLPLRLLTPSFEAGEYIAFLGRFSPEKGPEAAIRIATHAGVPLRLAAKRAWMAHARSRDNADKAPRRARADRPAAASWSGGRWAGRAGIAWLAALCRELSIGTTIRRR